MYCIWFFSYTVALSEWFLSGHWPKPAWYVPGKSRKLLCSRGRPGVVPSRQSACVPFPVFLHFYSRRSRELNIKGGANYEPPAFRSVKTLDILSLLV